MQPALLNQTTTNNNNTVLPLEHMVPVELQEFIFTTATGIVELHLQQSLWYQVQCVSCERAADALNVETDTVRQWIKAGKLPASKIGKDWSIRLVDLDKMLKLNATVIRMPDRRFKKFKTNIS